MRKRKTNTSRGITSTATLRLREIRLDFQAPENLIEETVLDYVLKIRRGESLPPIRVRFDGASYFCEDGFHRLEAARRTGLQEIRAEISPGTLGEMEAEFSEYLRQLRASFSSPDRTEKKKQKNK